MHTTEHTTPLSNTPQETTCSQNTQQAQKQMQDTRDDMVDYLVDAGVHNADGEDMPMTGSDDAHAYVHAGSANPDAHTMSPKRATRSSSSTGGLVEW